MRTDRRATILLAAIISVGCAVRVWGITFGLPHVRARPDELHILGVVIGMYQRGPNPKFFDYPGLYLYGIAGLFAVYYGLGRLWGRFAGVEAFVRNFYANWELYFLIPRVLGAVLGAATIGIVHRIGCLLLDRTTAILSALFLALAFLHVRDSHYATTDVPMTFFVMCTVLAAARVHRERKPGDAWLAGVMAGCAASTKYNAVLIVLTLATVELLHAWRTRGDWWRVLRETHILRMAAGCILVFSATNPYLFLDHETARLHLQEVFLSTASGMTPPEVLGPGWSYHLPNSLRHGLGLPLLTAGLLGMVVMCWRRPGIGAILSVFPIAYYAAAGAGYNVFVRYMIPVVPFLCLFAAYAVAQAARHLAGLTGRLRETAVAAALGVAVVAPSAWSVIEFDRLLAREDNRLIAARWVTQNVPAGESIYTAGNLYGHLQLEEPGKPQKYRYLDFDWRSERFTERGRPLDERPDWIVLQRSGIVYSHVSPAIEQLLRREYYLVHTLRAADLSEKNFYDIQDGFYAPFGSYKGVQRFGPNYEVYKRRE